MAYDPIRDAPGFRATLKQLAEVERLTSQAVVDLFSQQRVRGDKLAISRATLDRFIQGDDITKIRELRAIYDMLHANPAYRRYFAQADGAPAETMPDNLAGAMGRFLASAPTGPDGERVREMAVALPGEFILMRRDHDRVSVDQGVRVSTLSLSEANGGVTIRETQSYRTPGEDVPFEQTDSGYIFAHGPWLCFLMKEEGGTAVKFGVLELTLPEIERRQPVQYFQGHLMVVSRRGAFPRTRFAARRYSANQHKVRSGIVSLPDLGDPRAIEHLRRDYAEGGATMLP